MADLMQTLYSPCKKLVATRLPACNLYQSVQTLHQLPFISHNIVYLY